MKYTLIILTFFLGSCITINTTSTGFKDEIYYSAQDYVANENEETVIQNESSSSDLDTEIDSESDEYQFDDYYDYGYASRIRRFHSPFVGFGYYNNYYTNSYWYNYNPYDYGVSIYYGYNFWSPAYYDPFYHHPFGFYHGFYPHYHAYHNHYGHHFAGGWSYPTYYNSFDKNSVYYGPRENFILQKTPESFANRYVTEKTNLPVINASKPLNNKGNKPTTISSFSNRKPVNINQTNIKNNNSKPSKNNFNEFINSGYKRPSNGKISKPVNNTSKPVREAKPQRANNSSNNFSRPIRKPSFKTNSSPSRSNNIRPSNSRRPR